MPYLIGTDEAGYAPNLGPLVISASIWWVDGPAEADDLYRRLRPVVCKRVSKRGDRRRVAIADSKALYSPALGLKVIERGVLAALALAEHFPCCWQEIWQVLDADSLADFDRVPWHANYDVRLPVAADADDLAQLLPVLRRGLDRAGVRLIGIKSRAVFPDEFNHSTATLGNKAEALSQATLALVAESLAECPDGPVFVVCDKHGGRNFYQRLLQQQFPDLLVEVYGESPAVSTYRWGPSDRRIEIRFTAGGEAFLPAALASMTSKYLRELAMRAFNDFWCARLPELAPTAGYPRDARRFRAAIRPLQASLGIADHTLWRDR